MSGKYWGGEGCLYAGDRLGCFASFGVLDRSAVVEEDVVLLQQGSCACMPYC